MELTPVNSSHVAAIGYLEADRVLLVRYMDGSVYARSDWTPDQQAAMERVSSKGEFLREAMHLAVRISKGGAPKTEPEPVRADAGRGGPLNVLDEDAGKCCTKALANFRDRLAPWECPTCGLNFTAEMVGAVRHWRIKPLVVILRK